LVLVTCFYCLSISNTINTEKIEKSSKQNQVVHFPPTGP